MRMPSAFRIAARSRRAAHALRLSAAAALLLLLSACAHGPQGGAASAASDPGERVVGTADAAAPNAGIDAGTDAAADATASAQAPASEGIYADQAASATAEGDVAAGTEPGQTGVAPTEAEGDFASIYGETAYDPVADPTLPAPAELPQSYDPWETFNRRMHRFNNAVDRRVAKPLAKAYVKVVPRPVRLGVGNFFSNLGQPVSAVNALLQGKPKQAGQSLGRFVMNSTLGIGGLFDPATSADIPNRSEDFGQTLAVWGWRRSRYVELPLFGPRTLRDVFGLVGDAPLSPTRQVDDNSARIFLQGLQLVDLRAQLLSTDSLREGAIDDYALVRDAWLQRRDFQIGGDRGRTENDLPDYLLEENLPNPVIPMDAMPTPGTP